MPDVVKELQAIKDVLVKAMSDKFVTRNDIAELSKAYAMIDYQIVARKEKDMEWDD